MQETLWLSTIYNYFTKSTQLVFRDYMYQPFYVTVNNIYKEFPSFSELLLMATIKTEAIPIVLTAFPTIAPNMLANPYTGSFFTDIIKGTQSLAAWWIGLKHGTKEYELHRPVSDILKGVCKITLLSQGVGNVFIRDSMCEIPARAFLDAMTIMKTNQLDRTDINSWYDTIINAEFWIDTLRKAELKVLAGKITADNIVKPTINFISPLATQIFDKLGLSTLLEFINNKHTLFLDNIPLLPIASPGSMLKEIFTSSVIMPLVRISGYIKTDECVLIQYGDKYFYKKFMDIYESAINQNISIEYKYDANSLNTNNLDKNYCNNKTDIPLEISLKDLFSQNKDNSLIIHYHESDDFLSKINLNLTEEFWKEEL
ncbi:hypothetical protein NF27_EM00080 [Candidatus Jidaibacter acanthamoeba]|uniref:Uncharacterized protein n=2 Tax=Candidatus Jidaibacter acanthamoebae TaxID=86105 RepID=A0A0C1MSX1_9RICK|nr:hypothetical protein NF27_EM00080 [Candidatus Jidaibacter acanthamoeba]